MLDEGYWYDFFIDFDIIDGVFEIRYFIQKQPAKYDLPNVKRTNVRLPVLIVLLLNFTVPDLCNYY